MSPNSVDSQVAESTDMAPLDTEGRLHSTLVFSELTYPARLRLWSPTPDPFETEALIPPAKTLLGAALG